MQDEQGGRHGQRRSDEEEAREERAMALRLRTLRRLTGREPEEGEAGRKALVARLARALRGERQRGKAGHWSYDLNRHIALSQAYRAECAALRACRETLRAGRTKDHPTADPLPGSVSPTPTSAGPGKQDSEGTT